MILSINTLAGVSQQSSHMLPELSLRPGPRQTQHAHTCTATIQYILSR